MSKATGLRKWRASSLVGNRDRRRHRNEGRVVRGDGERGAVSGLCSAGEPRRAVRRGGVRKGPLLGSVQVQVSDFASSKNAACLFCAQPASGP